MTELLTGRYRGFDPTAGVPVSITVGQPKWPLGYELRHRIRRLAPFGLMCLHDDEFAVAYRAKLDKLDLDALVERFEAISAAEQGRPLILLCYEDVHAGQACHRRTFAAWWQDRTGQAMPEIPAKTRGYGQLSLAIDAPRPQNGESCR